MKDIMKIDKSLEELKMKQKNKKVNFSQSY